MAQVRANEVEGDTHALNKHLKVRDLIAFGIAAIIGAGIFSTIGQASAQGGPAVIFLFLFTALASGFAAFAYAEFASMVPVSGSAYTYSYVAFGELIAWIIGWALVMEYALGAATVSIAWSEYLNRLGVDEHSDCGNTIPIGALAEKLPSDLAKEYGNDHILRVVTKHDGDDMYYATTCPEGTALWLTVRDEEVIFNEMERIVQNIDSRNNHQKPIAVFHADCLARGRFLTDRILKEELVYKMQTPFYNEGNCPPWLGMYGFGEFARLGGKNTYHNYTTALYVIYRN